MKKALTFILLITLYIQTSCNPNPKEKTQHSRECSITVTDKIKVFDTDTIIIGKFPDIYIAGNYLILVDHRSLSNYIHLFDKYNFEHIKSIAKRGEGPEEISRIGRLVFDSIKNNIYVSDYGKLKIFTYNLDSALHYSEYKHYVKTELKDREFPDQYFFVNDSLSYARIIQPTGNSGFDEVLAKWSYTSTKAIALYKHPSIKKRRVRFSVSMADSIYAECYLHHDLITICDLDGKLKWNIYGPEWNDKHSNEKIYFREILFANKKIIASYSGGDNFSEKEFADKLIVFNLEGDYIKTLQIGYNIDKMTYDTESNRIYFSFNDMIQFGYLELTNNILK